MLNHIPEFSCQNHCMYQTTCMHLILSNKYSTVSTGTIYMGSHAGFSRASLPKTAFPHISLWNFFLLLPTQFFFVRTLWTIENSISIPLKASTAHKSKTILTIQKNCQQNHHQSNHKRPWKTRTHVLGKKGRHVWLILRN